MFYEEEGWSEDGDFYWVWFQSPIPIMWLRSVFIQSHRKLS